MANKNSKNKPKAEEVKVERVEVEEPKAEKVVLEIKGKRYAVRDDLGFKSRNFHTGSKLVKLVAGEEVDEKTYHLFNTYCKETFFK